MITAVKDSMTAKAAQLYLNNQISRYGRLTELKIDSRRKTMAIVGQLNGDDDPVTLQVGRYDVQSVGDKSFLEVSDFSCSRPWLQNLLEDFGRGRRVELPSWAANAL